MKVGKVLDNLSVCKKISSWLSVCGETKYGKSGGMAGKLRDQVTGCPIQNGPFVFA